MKKFEGEMIYVTGPDGGKVPFPKSEVRYANGGTSGLGRKVEPTSGEELKRVYEAQVSEERSWAPRVDINRRSGEPKEVEV